MDFGVGTFLSLGKAAYNAWEAFKAAGSAFRDLAADTKALNRHLDSTRKLLEKHGYKLDSGQQDSVNECAKRCKRGIREADNLLRKYPSLASKKGNPGEQLAAAIFTDVESLRKSLQNCVGFLSLTESSITLSLAAEGQDRIHSIRRILSGRGMDIGANRNPAPPNIPNMPRINRVPIIPLQNDVAQPSGGRPPLHEACAAGNTNLVGYLLKQGSTPTVRTQGSRGNALHIATWYGHVPVMRLLLDDGPFSTVTHPQKMTSKTTMIQDRVRRAETVGKTHMMIRASKSKELNEMRDVDGDTPLHIAVEKGNLAAVQLFLTKGAIFAINTQNSSGQTPLHIAAKHGLADIAQILLSSGARTSLKDNNDFTALALAKKGKHERCTRYLKKHIEKCIQAKAVKVRANKVPRKQGWFG